MQVNLVSVAGAIMLGLATNAEATPLSCDQFRDRFAGALVATLSNDVTAPAFTLGFTDPVRGRRYDWTSNGASGTLKCGQGNQFEEIVVNARFESQDTFVDTLKRFMTVTGASICALAADTPVVCADFGRSMLQETLQGVGLARNRGTQRPSGRSERVLFPGADAEMTAASTFVTFLLGPGRGASIDDARQQLPRIPSKPAP